MPENKDPARTSRLPLDTVSAARTAGHSTREIAEAAGVSHVAIVKTLRDH